MNATKENRFSMPVFIFKTQAAHLTQIWWYGYLQSWVIKNNFLYVESNMFQCFSFNKQVLPSELLCKYIKDISQEKCYLNPNLADRKEFKNAIVSVHNCGDQIVDEITPPYLVHTQYTPNAKTRYTNEFTPYQWSFERNFREGQGPYANQIAAWQYDKVATSEKFYGILPSVIKRCNVNNALTLDQMRHATEENALQVFLEKTPNGKSTARIMKDFSLEAISLRREENDFYLEVKPTDPSSEEKTLTTILMDALDANVKHYAYFKALDKWASKGKKDENRVEVVKRILQFFPNNELDVLDLSRLRFEKIPPLPSSLDKLKALDIDWLECYGRSRVRLPTLELLTINHKNDQGKFPNILYCDIGCLEIFGNELDETHISASQLPRSLRELRCWHVKNECIDAIREARPELKIFIRDIET